MELPIFNTASKDADDGEQLHELHDMLVEEVSLVDRAANKRRFLVVKQEDGSVYMAEPTELQPQPDGSLETTRFPPSWWPPIEVQHKLEEEKLEEEKVESPDAEDESEASKAALSMPGPVKESCARALTEVVERASSLLNKVKAATATDEKSPTPIPPEVGAEAKAIAQLLVGITDRYPSPKARSAKEDNMTESEETSKVEDSVDETAAVQDVEKAGARMSKDRYNRFKQAVSLLNSVFGEVSPPIAAGMKAKAKAEPEEEEEKKAKDAKVKKADDRASLDEMVGALADVVTQVSKAVAVTNEKVELITKSRGASHVLNVETSAAPRQSRTVSWPVDMTKPMDRNNVSKAKFWD